MCTYGTCGTCGYNYACYTPTRNISDDNYRLQVEGEGDSMPHCNWVRRCVVDTAFHLAQPQVEQRLPDGHLPGSRQPQQHEGSKVRYTWLTDCG